MSSDDASPPPGQKRSCKFDVDSFFEGLDSDSDDHITVTELLAGAHRAGAPLSKQGAEALLAGADANGDGVLSKTEFCAFVTKRETELEIVWRKMVEMAGTASEHRPSGEFPLGRLGPPGLRAALGALGAVATADEVEEVIARMDRDGDGAISFDEFRSFALLQAIATPQSLFCRPLGSHRADVLFRSLDTAGDGFISLEELKFGAMAAKVPMMRTRTLDASTLIHMADTDGDGVLSKAEFRAYIEFRDKELEKAFCQMVLLSGASAKPEHLPSVKFPYGRLTTAGLRTALHSLGIKASDAEVRTMFDRLDSDHDGTVSFEEFRDFATLLPSGNPRACFEAIRYSVVDAADGHCTPPPESEPTAAYASKSYLFRLVEKLFAGGVAGICSRTATAPVDRLKVIMQASDAPSKGIVAELRNIFADGGGRAFFRGNGANCIKIAPETGIKFVAFDVLRAQVAADPSNPTIMERFVAGGASGAIAQTVIYPLEIAKTRLALAPVGLYSGIGSCLATVARTEGPAALLAGLGPSLAGIVPYAGIDLGMNSVLKETFSRYYERQAAVNGLPCEGCLEPGIAVLLTCGMLSSTMAMLATYPLNLVRTRLQASGLPGTTKYNGPAHVCRTVLARDGLRGFYRGLVPNMMKVLPATSISYAVYGYVARLKKTE